MNSLYVHGKLLISAEYMVLHGSLALAIPLKQGQSLQRIRSENPRLFSWKATYLDQTWFSASLDPSSLEILTSSDPVKGQWLRSLILACIELMPSFQEDLFKWNVETQLDFSPQWGFGSSSTVTALMAEWAEVNPLDLHFMVSEGSGYDVACAIADGPIVYRIRDDAPHYQHVDFYPPFSEQIYFAWLGSKQPTADHLKDIAESFQPTYEDIHTFSCFTEAMIQAPDLTSFQQLMEEHELKLAKILKTERISVSHFPRIPGTVKSLGAWGGDFVMIASSAHEDDLFNYLYDKGIKVIFRYQDIAFNEREIQE